MKTNLGDSLTNNRTLIQLAAKSHSLNLSPNEESLLAGYLQLLVLSGRERYFALHRETVLTSVAMTYGDAFGDYFGQIVDRLVRAAAKTLVDDESIS